MTQSEMPKEVYVYMGKWQLGISTRPVDPLTAKANFPRHKYILASRHTELEEIAGEMAASIEAEGLRHIREEMQQAALARYRAYTGKQ